jgi:hypothetical protein
VRARTDTELLGLSRNGFVELFKSRPEAAAKIKEIIALRNSEKAEIAACRRV